MATVLTPEQLRDLAQAAPGTAERLQYLETAEQWQNSIFDAQAYLMTFADRIWRINSNQRVTGTELIRNNFPRIRVAQTQDPESLINRVTVNRDILNFMDGDSLDYTQLVPHIALYKVFVGTNKNVEVLYPFNNSTDFSFLDPISVHRQGPMQAGRGYAPSDFPMMGPSAGIKSVSWKMEGRGRNPFSAHILEITVKMFFQDVKTLFKPLPLDSITRDKIIEATGSDKFKLSYADLIRYSPTLRGGGSTVGAQRNIEALNESISHRVRLELGWNINDENPIFEGREETFVKAVQNTKINILADLTEHNINFKENGSVELVIRYRGATSNVMSHMDLLEPMIESGTQQFANQTKALLDQIESQGANSIAATPSAIQREREEKRQALQRAIGDLKNAAVGRRGNTAWNIAFLEQEGILAVAPDQISTTQFQLRGFAQDQFTQLGLISTPAKQRAIQAAVVAAGAAVEAYNNVRQQAADRAAEAGQARAAAQRQLQNLKNNIQSFSIFNVFIRLIEKNALYKIKLEDAQKAFWSQFLDLQNAQPQSNAQVTVSDFGDLTLASATADPNSDLAGYRSQLTEIFRQRPQGAALPSTGDPLFTNESISADTIKSEILHLTSDWHQSGNIYYFFLGDLINMLLEGPGFPTLGETIQQHLPGFKFILGPMKFTHPLWPSEENAAGGTRSGSIVQYNAGTNKSLINLFWIPIHLEVFMTFITDKIIASGRKVYPLMLFIEDFIKFVMEKVTYSNKLSATSSNRISLDVVPVNIKDITLERDFPTIPPSSQISPGSPIRGVSARPNWPITLDFDDTNRTQVLASVGRGGETPDIAPVWFITGQDMSADSKSAQYKGRIEEDTKKGIYHFSVGGMNRGILKSIEFTEIKQPFLAEATYRAAVGSGALQKEGVILPKKISVKLKLVGNPFFSIGQLFYIKTRLVDGGYFIKEQLGFGGYYYITNVETEYGIGVYNTLVEGILMMADHLVAENSAGTIQHIYDWEVQTADELTALDAARRRRRGGS